jgi:hypothetical protein
MKVTFLGVRALEATTDHHGKVVDFDGVMQKKRLEIKWSERRDSNHAAVFSYVLKLLWFTALQISCSTVISHQKVYWRIKAVANCCKTTRSLQMQPPSDGSTHGVGIKPFPIGTYRTSLLLVRLIGHSHINSKLYKEYSIRCPSRPFLVRPART